MRATDGTLGAGRRGRRRPFLGARTWRCASFVNSPVMRSTLDN